MQGSRSVLVCPCHDVTEADIDAVIASGHTSPETIKRATAVYMGSCQGKYCAEVVRAMLAERGIDANTGPRRPAARLPIASVPLGLLADPADGGSAAPKEG